MKRLQRDAVILALIEKLQKKGSWCGETHIQKACYLLDELFNVPLGFEFILYKHGPFSFDLSDELTAMRADGMLDMKTRMPYYGPTLLPAENSQMIQERFTKTLDKYEKEIDFIAEKVGDNGVSYLERVATALYVTCNEETDGSVESRAKRLNELKPHVTMEEALDAVKIIDGIVEEAGGVQ